MALVIYQALVTQAAEVSALAASAFRVTLMRLCRHAPLI